MGWLFDPCAIAHAAARRSPGTTFLDDWLLEEIAARLAPLTVPFEKVHWEGKAITTNPLTLPLWEGRSAKRFGEGVLMVSALPTPKLLCNFDPPTRGGLEELVSSYNLVISYNQLHHTNDVPAELLRLGKMLKPDGMFLACFPGGQSLVELRQVLAETESRLRGGIAPRVHPMIALPDAAALMQAAGFALPVVDSERMELHYPDLFALVRDLRVLGLTNMLAARDKRILPRAFWPQAAALYAQEFPNGQGGITVTLEAIFLSGWRPAETQQIPLARGSVPVGFRKN